ncbi:hypothetical protein HHK36_001277 [Tetracentron sinense]|uniref:Uncharacterized protein n=1 Tax=Tetracentron sinense TaxID=13715 RepID=A0A835DUM7_TETSI|nr:hypothetical protein HHK36_001277 [Tetracentron sinense]
MILCLQPLLKIPTSLFPSTFLGSSQSLQINPFRESRDLKCCRNRRFSRRRGGMVLGFLPVDPWAPSIDSQSIASQLFAASLFPYIGFLYFITKSKSAPKLTLFGFYFLLAFVGATSDERGDDGAGCERQVGARQSAAVDGGCIWREEQPRIAFRLHCLAVVLDDGVGSELCSCGAAKPCSCWAGALDKGGGAEPIGAGGKEGDSIDPTIPKTDAVGAVPAGIYAKVHYGTSLSNVDWLHGGAESLLTLTNLFIVIGLRGALRKPKDGKESTSQVVSGIKEEEKPSV